MKKTDKFDVVCICTGKDCKKREAKALFQHFKALKRLEGSKRRIKLVKTKCLDYCEKAPVYIQEGAICFFGNEILK
jgi:NADH-quinone oxidoreductase subunit F